MAVLQVSAAQQKTDALSFLKPFAWQLWLAILAVLLGVALFSNILSRLSPLRRYEVRARLEVCVGQVGHNHVLSPTLAGHTSRASAQASSCANADMIDTPYLGV